MYYAINIYRLGILIETVAVVDSHQKAHRIVRQLRSKVTDSLIVERCRLAARW